MSALVRASQGLTAAMNACLPWLFFVMLVLVTLQVVGRMLGVSLPWTEELGRLSFLFLVYFGAAAAFERGAMITIDSLPELSPRLWGWLHPVAAVLTFVIVLFFCYASIGIIRSSWNTSLSTLPFISNAWAYVAFAICFFLMALHMIATVVARLAAKRGSGA